jgi:predicted ATPase/class 3 adenylate cyclase
VHRDIKPANILMTSSGVAKVIDFGIAKMLDAALTGGTGPPLGTPAYMAPEQICGEVDRRTDIWGLGVVFYQMLTNRLPFVGENPYAQATAILHAPPRPYDSTVPVSAVPMLDRMLAKSPRDRYQTMDAVVADARQLLGTATTISGTDWMQAIAPAKPPAESTQVSRTDSQTAVQELEHSAERRQVTAVVCGLADLESIAERLDPEDLHELLIAYHITCADVVRRVDGHIARVTDDQIVVYFGYPSAHEDDGKRAVRCGLEIVQAVRSLPRRFSGTSAALRGVALRAAVGVHTGTIISGNRRGARGPELTGTVANIAARTSQIAGADGVVVTADTYRIVRRAFYCDESGVLPARGSAKAIPVHRIVSEVTGARTDAAESSADLPPIGRTTELETLLDQWRRVHDGAGHVVLVSGEAGIGKSRLLTAFRAAVAAQAHVRLDCQCSAYHVNSPLHPFVELLRRLFGLERDDVSESDKLLLLTAALTHHDFSDPVDHALFASLLSLPVAVERDGLQLGVQQRKSRLLAALSRLFLRLGGGDPTLLIVEDLHWIDPTSRELLGMIVDHAPTARMLIVLAYRPEFAEPWGGRQYVSHLPLARLSTEQTAALVQRVAGGKALPREVVARITATTDGVPLFVEELTKTLLESAAIRETPAGYTLTAPIASIEIPATIHDSLTARLDRLPSAKPIAQIASVLGREFPYAWLAAITPFSEAILQQELGRLVAAGLLQQRGVAPLAVFGFKHALIKDAAYQSLVKTDRQEYHRRIADALVSQFPDASRTQPELVAHHYTEAGQADAAARFWQTAGQRALEHSNDVEAAAHLTRGLEVLRTLPLDGDRQSRELAMQISRAAALRATQGFAASMTGDAYTDARALAVALGNANALITALNGLYAFHMVRAEHAQARPVAEELVRLADELGDATHQMVGRRALGAVLFHTGHPERARASLEQALAAYDPETHASLAPVFGTDHAETTMSFLSLSQWVLGRPDQALATQCGALAHAEQLRHLHTIAQALTYTCFVRVLRREAAAVHEAADRLTRLSEEHSFRLMEATARFWRGWSVAEHGDFRRGIAQMEQASTAWWSTGAQTYRSFAETLMANAKLQAGDLDEADALLRLASERIAASDERWAESEVLRVRGELARVRGDGATAAVLFRSAIACAAAQGARMWQLRAATSLARCLRDQDRAREAREALVPVLDGVTEGDATRDLQDARDVLGSRR